MSTIQPASQEPPGWLDWGFPRLWLAGWIDWLISVGWLDGLISLIPN
jgi:hypothetical protein